VVSVGHAVDGPTASRHTCTEGNPSPRSAAPGFENEGPRPDDGPGAFVLSQPFSPCWRNQATPCMLSGGISSQCLESLPPGAVIEAVMRLLRAAEPGATH
jgi:hypothetical protein